MRARSLGKAETRSILKAKETPMKATFIVSAKVGCPDEKMQDHCRKISEGRLQKIL